LHRRQRHDEAIEYYYEALGILREVGNRWGEGDTLGHLGDVLLDTGRPDAARARWREALSVMEQSGHPDAEAIRERLRRMDAHERDPGPDSDPAARMACSD
ncbi:tetratricopeptide repeat protein, partial [Streptomyces sp. NPDC006356]